MNQLYVSILFGVFVAGVVYVFLRRLVIPRLSKGWLHAEGIERGFTVFIGQRHSISTAIEHAEHGGTIGLSLVHYKDLDNQENYLSLVLGLYFIALRVELQ